MRTCIGGRINTAIVVTWPWWERQYSSVVRLKAYYVLLSLTIDSWQISSRGWKSDDPGGMLHSRPRLGRSVGPNVAVPKIDDENACPLRDIVFTLKFRLVCSGVF